MAAVMLEVALSGAGCQDMPHDEINRWDVGIEKHVGGTPLLPSSLSKTNEHHRHNPNRCCCT